jgi:fatty-acid desaturase
MSERNSQARLALPASVRPGDVHWMYAVPIAAVHLLALSALVPGLFSWTGLAAMLVGLYFYGFSMTLCYHRLLAHGSFEVPKWLERSFVVVALCSLEDTPGQWVATHRLHHANSDKVDDPHSPLVTFLWGHLGWLILWNARTHNTHTLQKYAHNILADPFYMYLEKHRMIEVWIYLAHAALYFAAGAAAGWWAGADAAGAAWFGLSLVVWGVLVRTVMVWHITWSVNSLTHLFGYRSYDTKDNSRNNWLVAVLASGEGWHNNHHYDPAACTVQHRWWEIDPTYYFIRLLQRLGLASRIVPVRSGRRRTARIGTTESAAAEEATAR